MNMDIGDTRLILSACMSQNLLRNQAAYVLATAYWETNRTMQPVQEAYWLSDEWRQKNLRYFPWHGRGYVQLTWETNYHKAKAETGVDVVSDPTLAMRADVAAQILVVGCRDGWFTGKKLGDYITLQQSNYRGARRVVNGTDKAAAIAEIARDYEAALVAEGYGVEPEAPVVNDRRDGTAPRKTPIKSTTIQAVVTAALATAGQTIDSVKELVGEVSTNLNVSPEVALAVIAGVALAWVYRERIRKWSAGDR